MKRILPFVLVLTILISTIDLQAFADSVDWGCNTLDYYEAMTIDELASYIGLGASDGEIANKKHYKFAIELLNVYKLCKKANTTNVYDLVTSSYSFVDTDIVCIYTGWARAESIGLTSCPNALRVFFKKIYNRSGYDTDSLPKLISTFAPLITPSTCNNLIAMICYLFNASGHLGGVIGVTWDSPFANTLTFTERWQRIMSYVKGGYTTVSTETEFIEYLTNNTSLSLDENDELNVTATTGICEIAYNFYQNCQGYSLVDLYCYDDVKATLSLSSEIGAYGNAYIKSRIAALSKENPYKIYTIRSYRHVWTKLYNSDGSFANFESADGTKFSCNGKDIFQSYYVEIQSMDIKNVLFYFNVSTSVYALTSDGIPISKNTTPEVFTEESFYVYPDKSSIITDKLYVYGSSGALVVNDPISRSLLPWNDGPFNISRLNGTISYDGSDAVNAYLSVYFTGKSSRNTLPVFNSKNDAINYSLQNSLYYFAGFKGGGTQTVTKIFNNTTYNQIIQYITNNPGITMEELQEYINQLLKELEELEEEIKQVGDNQTLQTSYLKKIYNKLVDFYNSFTSHCKTLLSKLQDIIDKLKAINDSIKGIDTSGDTDVSIPSLDIGGELDEDLSIDIIGLYLLVVTVYLILALISFTIICMEFLLQVFLYICKLWSIPATGANLPDWFIYGLNIFKGTQGIGEDSAPFLITLGSVSISLQTLFIVLFEICFIGFIIALVRKFGRDLRLPKGL